MMDSYDPLQDSSSWPYIRDHYLNSPYLGLAILVTIFLWALYRTFREDPNKIVKKDRFAEYISTFSSKERLHTSYQSKKEESKASKIKEQTIIPQTTLDQSSSIRHKSTFSVKDRVKDKYLRSNKFSLLYETEQEKRQAKAKREREIEEMNAKEKRRQMEEQRAKEKQKEKERAQKEKERAQKEKAELQRKQREKAKEKSKQAQGQVEGNQPSEKSLRSGERKTTIQMAVDQNEKKDKEAQQPSKTFSLFNNPAGNQAPSMFLPQESAPAINLTSNATIGQGINKPMPSIVLDGNQATSVPKINIPSLGAPQPSLFQNLPKPSQGIAPPQVSVPNPKPEPKPAVTIPSSLPSQPPQASQQPARPPPAAARQQVTLSSEQYLEQLMKFSETQAPTVQIPTLMANLGGAKSSLNDLLTFAQSFIDTINKASDADLTTFSVKIYEGIIRQISTSNLKDGIYRIPPKSKTDQVQKNSINCYILYINLYRLMGYEKVWTIVFGKLLKMLEFIYKRKTDLKKYTELELLANKHLEKRGQIQGKYLSRIDYLTYLLFGLTAFDPIQIFRQTQEKEPNVRQSRERVESWGRQWSYKQFWILTDLFLKNKHDSYFKPIIYMNILSSLYPRIYANKQNPQRFRAENQVYKAILDESKQYFLRFKNIPELKALRQSDQGNGFEYDGDNFVQGIKVLQGRLTVEKFKEFNLRLGGNDANAREFQAKSNVFYYFSKEK